MKRLTAVVLSILVAAPLLAFDTAVPAGISPIEISIISAMNRERAAYGLPPLRINIELTEAANDRISVQWVARDSESQADQGHHDPFIAGDQNPRLRRAPPRPDT